MDTARYVVAVLVWMGLPPAVVYWFLIHPFARYWRRLGKWTSVAILTAVFLSEVVVLYVVRDRFLVSELGTHGLLWAAALVSYGISIALELSCRRQLKFYTLAGLPELDREQAGRKLLDEGIYARIRHPRYVSVMFGMLAMALFANYVTIWVLLPLTAVSIYVVALLEERELVDSLGSAYEEYRRRVPMFVPRLRESGGGGRRRTGS